MGGNRKTKIPLRTILMALLLIWKESEITKGEIPTRLTSVLSNNGIDGFFTDKRHVEGLIRRGFIDANLSPTLIGLRAFGDFNSAQYVAIVDFLESQDEECEWQRSVMFEVSGGVLIPIEWAA